MRLRGIGRLQTVARRARSHFINGAVVLMYHRVTTLDTDAHSLAVTPEHFAEHLEVVNKYANPISLQNLLQAIDNRKIPKRAVAITFDDGYADNLYEAKPLLEHRAIPATVFVTTAYITNKREFWWDELEKVFLYTRTLPTMLQLTVDGKDYRWDLAKLSSRDTTCRAIYKLLRRMSEDKRQNILDNLLSWASVNPGVRPTHKILSEDEILEIANGELIEVGAHTVNHPVLSDIPPIRQLEEIVESKNYLEKLVGYPVKSFAYPYGGPTDYTVDTMKAARNAGMDSACTTSEDVVSRRSDRFRLPRLYAGDWDGERFLQHLSKWFPN